MIVRGQGSKEGYRPKGRIQEREHHQRAGSREYKEAGGPKGPSQG